MDPIEKKPELEIGAVPSKIDSVTAGTIEKLQDSDDAANQEFYGKSISDSYRFKSELVNKCMEEIGFGRYQCELFVVTGFGWITDNL